MIYILLSYLMTTTNCDKYKPRWDPNFWNNLDDKYNDITNCYSYAFNFVEKYGDDKVQPGELSGEKFLNYSCSDIEEKVKRDYDINYLNKLETKDDIVPCNHYKIALVLDDKNEDKDYHFYRQDLNGYWSHKTGKDPVSNKDASGNLIKDPKYADRNYKRKNDNDNNYYIFCNYYSVPFNDGPKFRYNY